MSFTNCMATSVFAHRRYTNVVAFSPMYLSHTIYNLQIPVPSDYHKLHAITEVMANFLALFHFLDFNLT